MFVLKEELLLELFEDTNVMLVPIMYQEIMINAFERLLEKEFDKNVPELFTI